MFLRNIFVSLWLMVTLVKCDFNFDNITIHNDTGLNIHQFLRKHEYPYESHWVTTEDGYILRMHRITSKKGTFTKGNKPAVLLMHGLLSSSFDWVLMGTNQSLGLVLADAGYDVWLGNNRGTTWSRNHVKLNPDLDKKFWDYSFETCGYYDLPAKIDYIIEKTGQQKIFYVGHSQGTTQFFAMAALRPEYNNKIALMSALAPVVYMQHLSSPLIRLMAQNMDFLSLAADIFNLHELLPHSPVITSLTTVACSDGSPLQEFCATFLFTLCGFNSPDLPRSLISVLGSNAPAGISIKMLVHYGQEIRSGYFRRYDYGGLSNLRHYKSWTPPLMDIKAITAPVALYYSENDFFAAVQDVERLAKELPNLAKKHKIGNRRFNHLDYVFAKSTNELINSEILAHFKEYVDNNTNGSSRKLTEIPMFALLSFILWNMYL